MAQNEGRKKVLSQIIIAVVVAMLVGSTAPWWWKEFFPGNTNNVGDTQNGNPGVEPSAPSQQTLGGSITVTATANPPVVSIGQRTSISTYVQDSQGRPLPFAVVTLSSGGGRFDRTGTTKVSGPTDPSGVFQAYWSCDPCAPAYISSARATKTGYEEADTQWRVQIR